MVSETIQRLHYNNFIQFLIKSSKSKEFRSVVSRQFGFVGCIQNSQNKISIFDAPERIKTY